MGNEQGSTPNNSRVLAGLLIIAIGILFFFRQAGWVIFPYWIFTWPMILIGIGLFIGIKHGFRGGGWLVMLIIGAFFLIDDVLDWYNLRHYLVPAILVGIGAMLILRPKDHKRWKLRSDGRNEWLNQGQMATGESTSAFQHSPNSNYTSPGTDTPEKLDATAIFGAVKKNIVSKNFIGGEPTSIFGGSEIDLSRADINGTVTMDVTAILGGIKLIVPSHWLIKQQVTAIFGGVEDKRDLHTAVTAPDKVLVLEGTAFMGGIEISSYR